MGLLRKYQFLFLLPVLLATLPSRASEQIKPAGPVKKGGSFHRYDRLPNAELETVHYSVTAISHTALPKNASRAESPCCVFIHFSPLLSIIKLVRPSSPPEKNYLLHIYPSHNFW